MPVPSGVKAPSGMEDALSWESPEPPAALPFKALPPPVPEAPPVPALPLLVPVLPLAPVLFPPAAALPWLEVPALLPEESPCVPAGSWLACCSSFWFCCCPELPLFPSCPFVSGSL